MRKWIKKIPLLPLSTAIISLIIMIAALWVKPLVGMADNGEYENLLKGQGLYWEKDSEEVLKSDYFNSRYRISKYYNEWEGSRFSSQHLYVWAAEKLNLLLGQNDEIFDIRFYSLLLMLQTAAGIFFLTNYLSVGQNKWEGILTCILIVLIFADTAYSAYLNSFYKEGIAYASLLVLSALALLLAQNRYSPGFLYPCIIADGIILAFLGGGYALIVPIILWAAFPKKTLRLAGVLLCLMILVVWVTGTFDTAQLYHGMTRGVMTTAKEPGKAVEEFGINGRLALLRGTGYFDPEQVAVLEEEWFQQEFFDRYSVWSLGAYYLVHPGSTLSLMREGLAHGYDIRPAGIGNFEADSGHPPGARASFFTGYSRWKQTLPETVVFASIWIIASLLLCQRDKRKMLIFIGLYLAAVVLTAYCVISAGDTRIAQGMFPFYVFFDLAVAVIFAPPFIRFVCGAVGVLRNKFRISTLLIPFFFLWILCGLPADAKENVDESILIVSSDEAQADILSPLAKSFCKNVTVVKEENFEKELLIGRTCVLTTCILPAEELRREAVPVIFLGKACEQGEGISLKEYKNVTVELTFEGYRQQGMWEEGIDIFSAYEGESMGNMVVGERQQAPFAVRQDQNYYIPYYSGQGLCKLLLGEILGRSMGRSSAGGYYLMLDKVYPYSDPEPLINLANILREYDIPFIVRVMPIKQNYDLTAFADFRKLLSYMQSCTGSIVLYETQGEEVTKAYAEELVAGGIYPVSVETFPVDFEAADISSLKSGWDFGTFLMPIVFKYDVNTNDEQEIVSRIKLLLNQGINFEDFGRIDIKNMVLPSAKQVEALVIEDEEKSFSQKFFDKGDSILGFLIGSGIFVLCIFLLIGRKWYWKKYYR